MIAAMLHPQFLTFDARLRVFVLYRSVAQMFQHGGPQTQPQQQLYGQVSGPTRLLQTLGLLVIEWK